MKVSVEDVSTVKKVLAVEIPQDQVVQALDDAYRTLKKKAKIKGFRPGKAPRSVLERLYRKDINSDVTAKLMQESLPQAIEELKLDIVGSPEVDLSDLDATAAYTYKATVEVRPEIEPIDFKGLKLKKTLYKIKDEEIDVQLQMLQKNLARREPIPGQRPLKKEDDALIDYEGFKDGKTFAETQKTENFMLKVGQGLISEHFDEQLVGMTPGESREFTVSFAQDYKNPKLAGQQIVFRVTLNEILQEVLPPIDDDFAKKLGKYESLEEVKKEIRDNLEQGYAKRTEQELNEQAFAALIEKTSFELPEALVNYELDTIVSDTEHSFARQNIRMQDVGLSREGISEKYRGVAEKQVRRHLILGKIIDQAKLELSDQEIEDGYAEMAKAFHQPVEEIKKYYRSNPDKVAPFKHALLEKKAVRLIFDSSTIEEVAPDVADSPAKDSTVAP